jgi:undecaprenyl phosphate N,N'-diacetylbacillosamine 1-phosphate transferase
MDNRPCRADDDNAMFRRLVDILCALAGLIVLSPALVVIAIIIRCESKGSPIFAQRRAGYKGKAFTVFKFRTMRSDVDPYGHSPHSGQDPRLTRFGRFLRETSLDELPQLLNILNGSMTLVGPRPLYERQVETWNETQRKRLDVKPGLTGYAQAYGRGSLPVEDKLALDVYYVEHRSVWLDVKIVFKTIGNVFGGGKGDVYEERYSRESEYESGVDREQ